MKDPERAFYSIIDFARELEVHPNTIRKAIKTGRINAFKVGSGKKSVYRIPATEVARIMLIDMQKKEI